MKRFMLAAVALLGVCGAASAQFDQNTLDVQYPGITFRGGVGIPLDDDLSDVQDIFINLAVEYQLSRPWIRGGETYFALDWFGANLSGGKGNLFPLTVNQRYYTGPGLTDQQGRTYFFVGLGVFFADLAGASETVFGIRGGLGTELGPHVVAEAALYYGGEASGVTPALVGVSIGYRF